MKLQLSRGLAVGLIVGLTIVSKGRLNLAGGCMHGEGGGAKWL